MPGEEAVTVFNHAVATVRKEIGEQRVATGEFGAMMQCALVNDGPVTILYDTASGEQKE